MMNHREKCVHVWSWALFKILGSYPIFQMRDAMVQDNDNVIWKKH